MGLVKIDADQAGFRRGFAKVGVGENRASRRKAVKEAGGDWRQLQASKRLREEYAERAAAMEAAALRMSPEEARAMLARWAARPGRTQGEVDALNRRAGNVD